MNSNIWQINISCLELYSICPVADSWPEYVIVCHCCVLNIRPPWGSNTEIPTLRTHEAARGINVFKETLSCKNSDCVNVIYMPALKSTINVI